MASLEGLGLGVGGLKGTSAPLSTFVSVLLAASRLALKKSASICGVTSSKLLAESGFPSRPVGVDRPTGGLDPAISVSGAAERVLVCVWRPVAAATETDELVAEAEPGRLPIAL